MADHDTRTPSPRDAGPFAPAPTDAGAVDVAHAPRRRTAVCISSEALFAGAAEVHIEHRGDLYRLQRTALGKLILTK